MHESMVTLLILHALQLELDDMQNYVMSERCYAMQSLCAEQSTNEAKCIKLNTKRREMLCSVST